MNLVDATVHSVNTVYAQLIEDVGPKRVVDLATQARHHVAAHAVPVDRDRIERGERARHGIGVHELRRRRHAHRPGVRHQGRRAATATSSTTRCRRRTACCRRSIAREVNQVLQQVVTRGTGVNARIGRPVAGKTGTGENWKDAWFVGSTPQLTTAVWVGFPQSELSMVPPRTREKVTGGTWPAQIWGLYEGAALAETPIATFPAPAAGTATDGAPEPAGRRRRRHARRARPSRCSPTPATASCATTCRTRDYPPGIVVAQNPAGAHRRRRPARSSPSTSRTVRRATRGRARVLGLLADQAKAAATAHSLGINDHRDRGAAAGLAVARRPRVEAVAGRGHDARPRAARSPSG